MFGTDFCFIRHGKKTHTSLQNNRTEWWVGDHCIFKFKHPVWLHQRNPDERPVVVECEVDTCKEMVTSVIYTSKYVMTGKEMAEQLAASCPKQYTPLLVAYGRKKRIVLELNPLLEPEELADELRGQLDRLLEDFYGLLRKEEQVTTTGKTRAKRKRPTHGTKGTKSTGDG